MSWRDRLQPASFRGVPFFVDGSSEAPGRRTVIHEFPGREDVISDDMGRAPDRGSIEAFVAGDDFDLSLTAILDALTQPGPGPLVHPTLGQMSVVIDGEIPTKQSLRSRAGTANFSFKYVKSTPTNPTAKPATGPALSNAANVVTETAGLTFIDVYTVAGMPSGFIDSAVSRIADAGAALARARNAISGALGIADDVTTALEDFADGAEAMASGDPAVIMGSFRDLGEDILRAGVRARDAVTNAVTATRNAADIAINRRTTRQTLAASAIMQGIGATDVDIVGSSPMAVQEAVNRTALTRMYKALSVAAIARASVTMPFTSYQEADAARAQLVAEIDAVCEDIDDETYVALRNLSVAIAEHLARVASELPEVRTYTVVQDTSSMMLAHWLYGDARRGDEIEARNAIRNPGLIAAGTRLEVTTA